MNFQILQGNSLEVLRTLPDASVNCCITSPPYWGLRDYGVPPTLWPNGWVGCLGLEPTPEMFICHLVSVFREVRRVLRADATLWVNIGDSYARNPAKGGSVPNGKHDSIPDYGNARKFMSESRGSSDGMVGRGDRAAIRNGSNGLKDKDLAGIPWMLAFALRADGWWLREDIIWAKKAPMPESVKDRCTRSHEYLFHFAKAAHYYHDADAIKEPGIAMNEHDATGPGYEAPGQTPQTGTRRTDKQRGHSRRHVGFNDRWDAMERAQQCSTMRNKRSVWTLGPSPTPEAHFATFPIELPETCMRAGCPEGGVVLDPFNGAGTTGLACLKNNRRYIGIELKGEYIEISHARARKYYPLLVEVA